MESIVVGMFDETDEALALVNDLEARGVPPDKISIETAAAAASGPPKGRTLLQKIGDVLSGRDSRAFAEGVRRGATVVSARVDDPLVDEAVDLMKAHGAVDIDERTEAWREEGWMEDRSGSRPAVSEEPEHGGIRVYPEVGAASAIEKNREFDQYRSAFQQHHRTAYESTGYPYEHYAPAYRHGWQLASRDEHQGRPWDEVESHAQHSWETHHPGTWERFKDAVRFGWDQLTGKDVYAIRDRP